MQIGKYPPSAILAPFIREFVIIESDVEFDSHTIPDTALVMAFRYSGNILHMADGNNSPVPSGAVSGLRRSGRSFHYTKGTANLLVILREGGMAAFSRMPAHELFGQSISSENLFPRRELDEILERLAEAPHHPARIGIMEAFLLNRMLPGKTDPLIRQVLQTIKIQHGMVRVKELAQRLYISQDALEKRFRSQIGATPKQYASIIRLRHLIDRYSSFPSLTAASYEAGYFDQSHFIKDFRLFTGQTPKDFFTTARYW